MRLKDTGLTAQDIKDKVSKYMIETYERFDFLAETAEGMYLYDENGTPYLDFYAGIAVNNAGNRVFDGRVLHDSKILCKVTSKAQNSCKCSDPDRYSDNACSVRRKKDACMDQRCR